MPVPQISVIAFLLPGRPPRALSRLIFPHLREITLPKTKSEKLRNALDFACGCFEPWSVQRKIYGLHGDAASLLSYIDPRRIRHGDDPPPLILEEKPDTAW